MEEPVVFENSNGTKLYGICHIPDINNISQPKIGINIVNPGIKNRVAPHRLNVKLARKLCNLGYFVLRFDPEGIGDSGGALPEGLPIGDIWHKVQSGLFVNDTLIANKMFITKYNLDRIIVMGNCGGAITALLAGARDIRVDGIVLVDVPVIMWSSERSIMETATGSGEKLDYYFKEYLNRILRPEAWYRLLTFRTDYRGLWYTIKMKIHKKFKKRNGRDDSFRDWQKFFEINKINSHFINAFDKMMETRRQILFITGGNDPLRDSFHSLFEKNYLKYNYSDNDFQSLYEIFLIPDANHVYTLIEWQSTLMDKVLNWMKSHYPLN
jgi:pimeloyl-ACP methyl ester carboxylesterase